MDMLNGKAMAVVVSNYSAELEKLKKNKSIYFSKHPMALGVIDGINFHTAATGFKTQHAKLIKGSDASGNS